MAIQHQLEKKDGWSPHCTAVLISEKLALTAAHCVPEPVSVTPLRIAFTTNTDRHHFHTRSITAFVRDEKFEDKVLHEFDDHDLALVRFSGGIPPGFKPARLLSDISLITSATPAIVAGFGSVNYKDPEMGILHFTTVKVAKLQHGETETLLDQRDKGGTCSGDSGGPLFLENKGELLLWGIASRPWPLDIEDCAQYVIYSRLDAAASWLKKAAKQLRN